MNLWCTDYFRPLAETPWPVTITHYTDSSAPLYDGLPVEQRMKDYIFGAIVAAFFECNAANKRQEAS